MMGFIEELKVRYGAITSDDLIRKELVREVIYREANILAVGTKIVPEKQFSKLAVEWIYPSEMTASYPVGEGAKPPIEEISWSKFSLQLQKAVVRFAITDEAKLRDLADEQIKASLKRAAEALAKAKDTEIIETLLDNAFYSVSASATWDDAAADPVGDIVTAIGWMLENSYMTENEVKKIAVIVPAKVYPYLNTLREIDNITQSYREYMEKGWGISFHVTRNPALGNNVIVMLPGELTAIHGVLKPGAGVPLTEEWRDPTTGITEYIVRQYFKTAVFPDSNRIVKITGVY